MKIVPATVLTFGLLTFASSQVFADVSQAPLAPGKPAGVHNAQFDGNGTGMLVVAGVVAIGIGIALATASNNVGATSPNNTGSSVSSTSTTSP